MDSFDDVSSKRSVINLSYENVLRSILVKQRRDLSLNGKLTLSFDLELKAMKEMSAANSPGKEEEIKPELLKTLGIQPKLRILDLKGSKIRSLEFLQKQPALQIINADGSRLETLAGLSRHPHLKAISFNETPLALKPNIRIAAIVVIGNRLTTINHQPVKLEERKKAAQYPLIAKYLLEEGWQLTDTIPSKKKFLEIFQDIIKSKYDDKPETYFQKINMSNTEFNLLFTKTPVFSGVKKADNNRPQEVEEEDQEPNADELDDELQEKLSQTLSRIGIRVKKGEMGRTEILDAITAITNLVKIFDNSADQIIETANNVQEND